MGLDIAVGVLALERAQGADEQDLAFSAMQFKFLNEVLSEAGLAPHSEPIHTAETFEAQMFGYSGLHTVRRLAAWIELEARLPPDAGRSVEASKDPKLELLYQRLHIYHQKFGAKPYQKGLMGRLLGRTAQGARKPDFQHLLWHSDAEGFYIPQRFDDVVLDSAKPQRPSVGGMVGSSFELLQECRRLAEFIELPADIDPESEELWELADSPRSEGPAWKQFGVESFCLARLLRAAALSVETGAAIVFR
jgi:hypothetical protein